MFILILHNYRDYPGKDENGLNVTPILLDVYDDQKEAEDACSELNDGDGKEMVYEWREADHIGINNFDNIWYSHYESSEEYPLKLPNYRKDRVELI